MTKEMAGKKSINLSPNMLGMPWLDAYRTGPTFGGAGSWADTIMIPRAVVWLLDI